MNNFKNIYILTTMDCNIHCEHCFIPKVKNELNDNDLSIILNFINLQAEGTFINLVFHGGEPTLVGPTKFTYILDYFVNGIKPHIQYKFNIQTNLINLSNPFIDIYKKYFNSDIGISYDVGIRHLKGSNDFETVFFKNIKTLVQKDIDFTTIITLTKKILEIPPKKFYLFLKENFPNVHIEKLAYSGEAIDNWDTLGCSNLEYSEYMLALFKLYSFDILDKNLNFSISPLESIVKSLVEDKSYSCKGNCSNFFSFGPNSYVGTCTALTTELAPIDYKDISNTNNIEISKVDSQTDCNSCEFLSICKKGCPSGTNTIYDYSNECRGSKILLEGIQSIINKNSLIKSNILSKKLSIESYF